MKILVVGSGGREHTICWALKRNSQQRLELFCAPGNAGIAQVADCVPIQVNDLSALAKYAEHAKIDLTMVGPEAPLAAGIVDEFERRGLRIIGPTKAAARLESSKAFAKDFMTRHSIPTARYRVANSIPEAQRILESETLGDERSSVVIKADGLAAGKGVFVTCDRDSALAALQELESGAVGAEAANRIVIEETLIGREISLLMFADGNDYKLMPLARDHKRIGEGDTGPNTGGMGAITDRRLVDDETLARIVQEIVEPTLQGCRDEGFPFRGILFIGLMLTADGPQVLEYNVRFGDPETQAILVRLKSDLGEIFNGMVDQRLGEIDIHWSDDSSACVVLAAKGYPAKAETGARITGLDAAPQHDEVTIFHAATSRDGQGAWLTAGGRVLGVTATGPTLEIALSRAYEAVADIHWDGKQYRRDIGRFLAPGTAASG
jgi:phosphoribosylamine--glycine ligase